MLFVLQQFFFHFYFIFTNFLIVLTQSESHNTFWLYGSIVYGLWWMIHLCDMPKWTNKFSHCLQWDVIRYVCICVCEARNFLCFRNCLFLCCFPIASSAFLLCASLFSVCFFIVYYWIYSLSIIETMINSHISIDWFQVFFSFGFFLFCQFRKSIFFPFFVETYNIAGIAIEKSVGCCTQYESSCEFKSVYKSFFCAQIAVSSTTNYYVYYYIIVIFTLGLHSAQQSEKKNETANNSNESIEN